MSLLKSAKPMNLNFSKGFTLFTSIKILPQKHKGRKVIFQIADTKSQLSFSLGLDEKNELLVWGNGYEGNPFLSKTIDKKFFLQKNIFLHFSVIPPKPAEKLTKLELGIGDFVDQTEIIANLSSDADVVYSIGGNLEGKDNAAFEMAALSLYNTVLNPFQIQEIAKALQKEFGGNDE